MWNDRRDEDQPKRPFPLRKLGITLLVAAVILFVVVPLMQIGDGMLGLAGIAFVLGLIIVLVGPKEVERNEKGR